MDAIFKAKTQATLKFFLISALVLFVSGASLKAAEAATLYLSSSTGTYTTGKNFTVSVRVSTSQSMNAADGVIHFPTDKLQVISISKTSSIFNLWVQEPSYSNAGALGNFRFEGVVLNPGFTGDGKIMDVTFQVRSEGTANAVFASGSVLANDGQGTNVVSALNGGTYNLQKSATQQPETLPGSLPPKPTVRHFTKATNGELVLFNTSENGTKWTNSPYAKLTWLVPGGTIGVTTLLNERSDSSPGTKSEGLFDSKTFSALGEGQHYFHARFLNSQGAGPIVHYPLFVDLTPPKSFSVAFTNKEFNGSTPVYTTSNPKISIEFATTDALSGIDRYEIKTGTEDWIKTEVPPEGGTYILIKQKPGTHQLIVRAIDKAGNFVDASAQISLEPVIGPTITDYTRYLTSPGEKLFVEGTASPRAAVEVKFAKSSDTPTIVSARADNSGNWQLVYDGILKSGSYRLTAKQILENGAESLETDPVRFSVNSLFWRIFSWILNIGGLFLVLLTVLAALLFASYYYWHQVKMFRKRLHREAKEAEEALHHGIAQVRKELEKGEPRSKIAKDLGALDKDVEKEIRDIEKS